MRITADSTAFFVEQILAWYQKHGRHDLPWRGETISPYHVWVSEIMLQQTQVNRVIPFYNTFIKRFPEIESLSQASWEDFLPYYQGLGYYNRARNMLKTAKIIVEDFSGEFPRKKEDLKNLPGIGEYTANAILSFGYGLPHLAFDTNHQRVWGRYFFGDKKAELDIEKIETSLPESVDYFHLNAAIMDFASIGYTNANPDLENSPLQPKCEFWKTRGVLESGQTKQKNTFPTSEAQVYLFLHENHQKYFSQSKEYFQPFILGKEINTRSKIKQHFSEKYHLNLSIRPPYKKIFLKRVPTLFVRAQVLLGEHKFFIFSREEANLFDGN